MLLSVNHTSGNKTLEHERFRVQDEDIKALNLALCPVRVLRNKTAASEAGVIMGPSVPGILPSCKLCP